MRIKSFLLSLFFFMLIFNVSVVSATIDDYDARYEFEQNTYDETGVHNASNDILDYSTDSQSESYSSQWTATNNDFMQLPDHADFDWTTAGTITFWMNVSNIDDNDRLTRKGTSWSVGFQDSGDSACDTSYCMCFTVEGLERECYNDYAVPLNGWQHWAIVVNATHQKYFINGTLKSIEAYSVSRTISTNANDLCIGSLDCGATEEFDGMLDDLRIYKRAMHDSEISDLFAIYGGGSPATPSISLNTNLVAKVNTSLNPEVITFNGTLADHTTDLYNCTLYNYTNIVQTLNDTNVSITQNFTVDVSNFEGTYNFSVKCENFEANDQTAYFIYKIDTIEPKITSSQSNNSVFYKDDEITFTFTFQDTNLHAYNISWINVDDSVIQSYFTTDAIAPLDSNTSSYTFTTQGNRSILVEAWDSHTNNKVRSLEWFFDQTNNLVADGFYIEGDIKQYNNKNDLVTYFYYDYDRYKLQITFEETKLEHVVNLSGDIEFIEDSDYKCHFVDFGNKRWIDFEGENVKMCSVNLVSPHKYELHVSLFSPSDEILFESVGDLNYLSKTYYFEVLDEQVVLLRSIDGYVQNIEEGISMIWIVVLYGVIVFAALKLFSIGSMVAGYIMMIPTFGLDLILTAQLYRFADEYFINNGWLAGFHWVGVWIFAFYMIVKVLGMFFWKYPIKN